ncbi:hotdog fold thioesterase, partial [Aduncisulcus paluster]
MPIDCRTHQIQGILHGGSSVLFAETLGSLAGVIASEKGFTV